MDATLGQVSGEFGVALLYFLGGIVFVVGGLTLSKLLSPNRPNPEKLSTYECGEDPVGNARIQLNNRFYVAALIFLIFDVEIVFLYPWATV
ncbi:MAG TPA: NADH-quinone oxidoreductase subunit A, partial [Bacteroidia bacterium]|nr:NADH-quinone oxidoreductase subunit A [Bacteroidia bacterium]